jgi:hypothetical protein
MPRQPPFQMASKRGAVPIPTLPSLTEDVAIPVPLDDRQRATTRVTLKIGHLLGQRLLNDNHVAVMSLSQRKRVERLLLEIQVVTAQPPTPAEILASAAKHLKWMLYDSVSFRDRHQGQAANKLADPSAQLLSKELENKWRKALDRDHNLLP